MKGLRLLPCAPHRNSHAIIPDYRYSGRLIIFRNIIKAIAGDPNKKDIQRYSQSVADINALEPEFRALSDAALLAKTAEFKAHIAEVSKDAEDDAERLKLEQAALDDLLPEAFAAVREATKRTIGLRHYDIQLIGGMALHAGKIAEMRTGEGKTLVATLPVYLNALTGRGVHLVTVNDYLARRDARWMGPIYELLGLTVGVLQMASRTENGRKALLIDPGKSSPTRTSTSCAWWTAQKPTRPTSPTAPTTSLASTTCATTWPCAWTTASSASATSPSSTRWTTSSSTRRARR